MPEAYSNQAIAKAIVPKAPGLLSAIASSYVIYDILHRKRGSVYRNRLLIGLSVSDIIGSIAFGFISSWAIPRGTPGIFLAAGTEATCKAQGFLLQLANTTSPLYSGSLSFYYLMTVARGWSESDVKRYEIVLHGIPIFFGVGTAFVGLILDLYHPVGLWCWFGPPGPHFDAFRWGMAHSFIWSTIFFGAYVMFTLYRKVRALEKTNAKYLQPGQNQQRNRSKNVAIQGILFTCAYFLAYIGGFLTRFVQSLTGKVYFQLIIIMAALLPAQGIFNFFVYMRPRWTGSGNRSSFRQSSKFSKSFSKMFSNLRSETLDVRNSTNPISMVSVKLEDNRSQQWIGEDEEQQRRQQPPQQQPQQLENEEKQLEKKESHQLEISSDQQAGLVRMKAASTTIIDQQLD